MTKIAFIVNSMAWDGGSKARLLRLLPLLQGREYEIIDLDLPNLEPDLERLVRKDYTYIVACGGDGTVSLVAQAVLRLNLPVKLGILPFGTFNHFARDLGIPLRAADALELILRGKSAYVDAGKVNEVYFINNSSLGLYPRIIRERNKVHLFGIRKIFAFIRASILAFQNHPKLTVTFASGEKQFSRKTPFVFVGNNKYEFSKGSLGSRRHLDQGILSIAIMKDVRKLKMIRLAWKATRGTILKDADFNVFGLSGMTIAAQQPFIDVSYDGELSKLRTPLQYSLMPKALHIIVP